MFPSNAEQPRRISVKEKEGKNTLLLPTPASHFGLQRFQAARGRVSAVFREMTCLCTSAALFGSEAACPGAAPLHFWLTLPSLAWRSLAGAVRRGLAGPEPREPPAGQLGLAQLGAASQRWRLPQKAQLPLSLWRICSQTDCHKTQHAEARGRQWAKTGSSLGTA